MKADAAPSTDRLPGSSAAETSGGAAPVYTLAWWRRRGWLWLVIGGAYGACYAIWHASSMNAWPEAMSLGLRSVPACLIIVSAGRLLASWARHSRLEPRIERWTVVAAILAGLAIGYFAGEYAGDYHAQLMEGHRGKSMNMPEAARTASQALGDALGSAPSWIILFLASGGYELPGYLAERRRLADQQRRRELASLRVEKGETDMQLAVLQAQIEPHFLFNTLASVRSLVATEPQRAAETIDALSDYLRATLPKLRESLGVESATLADQVDICARYLDLMKLRMGGRLEVVIDVLATAENLAFPPLILMPLVENAVKHGVEPKAGPGRIAIRAKVGDGKLEVAVEDDGAGLSDQPGSGVGLANVAAQLRNRFGGQASLAIGAAPGGGVRAAITLPAEPA